MRLFLVALVAFGLAFGMTTEVRADGPLCRRAARVESHGRPALRAIGRTAVAPVRAIGGLIGRIRCR